MRLLALLLVVCPAQLLAQGVAVSGVVADDSGGRLPGAIVTLRGPKTREISVTDGTGSFQFVSVAAGDYEIVVAASGFAQVRQTGIIIGGTSLALPPITLSVAGLAETGRDIRSEATLLFPREMIR